jgi:hypothetical protein
MTNNKQNVDIMAPSHATSSKKGKKNSRNKSTIDGNVTADHHDCTAKHTTITSSTTVVVTKNEAAQAAAIKGQDDAGNFYNSHAELLEVQASQRDIFYQSNASWWMAGGYGGATDDEEMIGDEGGAADAEEGLAFLDKLLDVNSRAHAVPSTHTPLMQRKLAVDVGAGLGRVTRGILLKRYDEIQLIEGNPAYCKLCKLKIGKKKATRCVFTQCYLQDITPEILGGRPVDLIWIQWTLQYLTDLDVVKCLKTLALGMRPFVGVIIVKENRPYGTAREDRFQMDTPGGPHERYDITRSDAHHRLLFQMAGLNVISMERGEETHTYVLR